MKNEKKSFKQCQVCGSKSNLSSSLKNSQLTMISFDVCNTCEKTDAEPFEMLVAAIAMDDSYSQAPEYQGVVNDTLKRSGRSLATLKKEVLIYLEY